MAFVITMGGLSKRFSEAGYNTPKYALPLGNKTLFEFAVHLLKIISRLICLFLLLNLMDLRLSLSERR